MTNTLYDNPEHWKEMHRRFEGSLRSVGRSGLSETYNRYKYRSEEETFTDAFAKIVFNGGARVPASIRVLDIGAGIGYWLNVVKQIAGRYSVKLSLTALDLSETALNELSKNIPEASCLLENAGIVNPGFLNAQFDLVMSNYCLHHITQTEQFKNALLLAVNSVKPGGYVLLMDCWIDRKYSPFYTVDSSTFTGSGLSRPLYLIDKICSENNLKRVYMADPISYLMNNVLEADTPEEYQWKSFQWKILHRIYKSELASKLFMPVLFAVDRYLKSKHRGYSTRLVVYHKKDS